MQTTKAEVMLRPFVPGWDGPVLDWDSNILRYPDTEIGEWITIRCPDLFGEDENPSKERSVEVRRMRIEMIRRLLIAIGFQEAADDFAPGSVRAKKMEVVSYDLWGSDSSDYNRFYCHVASRDGEGQPTGLVFRAGTTAFEYFGPGHPQAGRLVKYYQSCHDAGAHEEEVFPPRRR